MVTAEARELEKAKYLKAYMLETYGMGAARMMDAQENLALLERGSYLDVGCGRGEMLRHARRMQFDPVLGVEIVPSLVDGELVIFAEAHALPFADNAWDVVTLFDVIEHLVPGDDEAVCRELMRVARRQILITANNWPSLLPDGTELHINKRAYDEWERLFKSWFAPADVRPVPTRIKYERSPMWRVTL